MNNGTSGPANGTQPTSPLLELAEDISRQARIVSEYFAKNHIPQPSFELDGPDDYSVDLPQTIHDARTRLRGAAADICALAAGPKQNIMWMVWNYHDVSALDYVHHFRVAEAVPLIGAVPIEKVAVVTHSSPSRLKRVLRYLMLHHIFAEPTPGYVAHTPSSRLLATSEHVRSWVGVRTEETGPAAFGLVAAAKRWDADTQELEQSPFSHVHSDGKLSRFDFLALPGNRYREARFENLMKALQSTEPYGLKHSVLGYPWHELGRDALVVDVGGNTGTLAQALAAEYTGLQFLVQDLPSVVDHGRAKLPMTMSGRISFMTYNILERAQPITTAAAYCFRQIFHDWPDKYAERALRNTAKVLSPGQKIIIIDVVMPPPQTTLSQTERQLRRSDMEMLVQFNALEREIGDWTELLKRADDRLVIQKITQPVGSANTIIEAVTNS